MNTQNVFGRYIVLAASMMLAVGVSYATDHAVISDSTTYPLATCPVTGQSLDAMGGAVIETIDDREVRFCCAGCIGRYRADIETYAAAIDAAVIEQQREHYPTDQCVVMNTELGSMGAPVEYVHHNRLVRFCCAGCVSRFEQNPEQYLTKLDAAAVEKAQAAGVPDTCAVTGEALGDTPTALVIANQVLWLHTEACAAEIRKDPPQYLHADAEE